MVMANDHDAIEVILRTINGRHPQNTRMVIILNTHKLERFVISKALEQEANAKGLKILTGWDQLIFNPDGNLDDACGLIIGR